MTATTREFATLCRCSFAEHADLRDFDEFRILTDAAGGTEAINEVAIASLDDELFFLFATNPQATVIPVLMTVEPLMEVAEFLASLVAYAAEAHRPLDVMHTVRIEDSPLMEAEGIVGAILLEAGTLEYLDFLPERWVPEAGAPRRVLMPVCLDQADFNLAKESAEALLEKLARTRRDLMSALPVAIPGD